MASKVKATPFPPELPRSRDYRLFVNGEPVDAIEVPKPQEMLAEEQRFAYSFATFDIDGEASIEVEAIGPGLVMRDPAVLPARIGAKPELIAPDRARFAVSGPCRIVFEADGRHRALVIAIHTPENGAPRPGDDGVIYVGPGLHRRDLTVVGAGQTLYLAPGAVLEGAVLAEGDNAKILGRGMISGAPWPWLHGPEIEGRENFRGQMVLAKGCGIEVRDIALLSSWGWTLVLDEADDAIVEGVSILGGRVINDDGIDVCRSRGVSIRDCFVRCQDDCIAPKWWFEDLSVSGCTLWTDYANVFRVGYECSAPPAVSGRLAFRDIDILHTTLSASETTSYWANCMICIQASNGHVIDGVLFEGIRVHEVGRWDILLLAKTMPISVFFDFPDAGVIRNVVLKDIRLPESDPRPPVRIEAHDAAHPVEGVRFENVSGYGRVEIEGAVTGVEI